MCRAHHFRTSASAALHCASPCRQPSGTPASVRDGMFLPVPVATGVHFLSASGSAGAICQRRDGHVFADAITSVALHATVHPAALSVLPDASRSVVVSGTAPVPHTPRQVRPAQGHVCQPYSAVTAPDPSGPSPCRLPVPRSDTPGLRHR